MISGGKYHECKAIRFYMTANSSKFLLLVIAMLLGLGAGWLAYTVVTYRLPSGHWQRLGTLPEKPTLIIANQGLEVFIRTIKDNVYECALTRDSCELASLQTVPSSRIPPVCDFGAIFTSPTLHGNIVDKVEYHCFSYVGLSDEQFSFVILNDNSIWAWARQFSEYEFINKFAYMGAGIVLGFLVGCVILILRGRKGKPQATMPG
jgi:hypothetical protein